MVKSHPVGELENKIFIQNGFFYQTANIKPNTPLHRHHYTEIHVVAEGRMHFWIDKNKFVLNAGEVLLIPARKYHSLTDYDEGTIHTAFQIDVTTYDVVQRQFPEAVLKEFFNEILLSETKNNYLEIVAYITLICARLIDSINIRVSRNISDSLVVSNFFETMYHQDVHVSDLSELLHISDRQTQLLVKRTTGRTFRQELTHHRMKIANYLAEHTDLSLAEIAFKVGFKSYSGFWKVYKDFKKNSGMIK